MDETEGIRRVLVQAINASVPDNEVEAYAMLIKKFGEGNVWDTEAVQRDFEIIGFMAPFVGVIRRSDHKKGLLEFSHSPRFYFDFRLT